MYMYEKSDLRLRPVGLKAAKNFKKCDRSENVKTFQKCKKI